MSRLPLFWKVALGFAAILLLTLAWAVIARGLAPRSNTTRSSFDAIIVLGVPADRDGNPSPVMLSRVTEGVREYQRGVAPHIIFTGAAAHNQFVEAEVMARVAEAQGVPRSVILREPRALDTIQNLCYSEQILREHNWQSAEVVSNPSHLPRAAMILTTMDPGLKWRVHDVPEGQLPVYYTNGAQLFEILKTARYLAWARWTERCDPNP
jgi:uncharacterized SAM-binding protein YcdF (DUF218 family)